MSQLWPRINSAVAQKLFVDLKGSSVEQLVAVARKEHAQTTFAATGGVRVSANEIGTLAVDFRSVAAEYGYPNQVGDVQRVAFDRAAAEVLFARMDMSTVEAANRGVWNFLALVVAPDVVLWRFGRGNAERWVASDLTRHMFSRLWWQALTFGVPTEDGRNDYALLQRLSESDLNQITERRSIAGHCRLAQAVARFVTSNSGDGGSRALLRELTPRLRRLLAFVDFAALTDEQIDDHIRTLAGGSKPGRGSADLMWRPC